jgi:trans-aconitate methyltransferase
MTYEFDGEEYRKASAHQKEWGDRLIQSLDLKGDERVLDLGCGDGELTARLALRVPQGSVLGIDASQGMIAAAGRHRAHNLRFALQDINALDYEDAFDLVFSNATLHWVKGHQALLGRVCRALRSGGALRFNFAGDGNCTHLLAVLGKAMALPAYRSFFDDFDWPWFMPTVEQYQDLVRQHAFRDIRVWLENADHFFTDAQAMARWIEQPSLVPFLAHLGEPHHQAFRNFVVEQMVQATRRPDGRCFETFRRINVFARK